MKKLHTFIVIITLITFTLNLSAQQDGWVELINGKDFTGWKASENEATWTVVDGMFQAVGKRSHLFYNGEHLKDGFKNFEIDVWVRTYKLANSGVFIHTQYQQEGWPSNGMEIQMNNTHIGEGGYIEYKKTASLYGIRNVYKAFGKDSVWQNLKATVESDRVQIWIDGTKTVDYVPSAQSSAGAKPLSKGTFALQGHDVLSKMQYKSFKVRRLSDDARAGITPPSFGPWYDSLKVWQNRQFAFIDLNPHTDLSAFGLASYTYQTGINTAFVKNVGDKETEDTKYLPIFTGIRVNARTLNDLKVGNADYVVGTSIDIKSAQKLLASGKINIWAHKGEALGTANAETLLDLAKQNNVAIEIDNEAKTPSVEILKLAKSKGCKFTFSGLVPAIRLENSTFVLAAIKEAGLDYKDLYIPKM